MRVMPSDANAQNYTYLMADYVQKEKDYAYLAEGLIIPPLGH